jgi:L-ascorbate 6-phosphate lactonase
MGLMQEIKQFEVPPNQVGVWWLGQNGFIFKTAEGTTLSVDLYLTNSVPELLPDLPVNLQRELPIFLAPDELETDIYACTHSHFDHADPHTIRVLRNKDTIQFVGPALTCRAYRDYGIESGRMISIAPQEEISHRDIRIEGTFALPTDDSDLNHIGFLLTFYDKYRIYITGDTDHCELLASVAKREPQTLITCINGNYNNLSHWEAAELAKWVNPKVAIPCHYDMFPDNSIDPAQFHASLKIRAPKVNYLQLSHAKPFLLG